MIKKLLILLLITSFYSTVSFAQRAVGFSGKRQDEYAEKTVPGTKKNYFKSSTKSTKAPKKSTHSSESTKANTHVMTKGRSSKNYASAKSGRMNKKIK